jgi:hypothetical protein
LFHLTPAEEAQHVLQWSYVVTFAAYSGLSLFENSATVQSHRIGGNRTTRNFRTSTFRNEHPRMSVTVLFGRPGTRAHRRSRIILTSRRDTGAFLILGCVGVVSCSDTAKCQ